MGNTDIPADSTDVSAELVGASTLPDYQDLKNATAAQAGEKEDLAPEYHSADPHGVLHREHALSSSTSQWNRVFDRVEELDDDLPSYSTAQSPLKQ